VPGPPLPPDPFRDALLSSARFWELRRILYNLILTAVAFGWIAVTWPHFRPAFRWNSVPPLAALVFFANLCYCAAYVVDLPLVSSALAASWRSRRWILWLLGTLLAVLFENYWIADEIYPYVS